MIQHLSYSSLMLFLHNPSAFHKKYILGVKELRTSPAALTGVAFHKYAEFRMKGYAEGVALSAAKQKLGEVTDVDWGKTGSKEKCEDKLIKLISAWNSEYVLHGTVKDVEKQLAAVSRGVKVPLFGYADLIVQRDESLHVIDWKTTDSLEDELKPEHIVQGFFYKWMVEKVYSNKPLTFEIVQIKASENKDGNPRVKQLVLTYADHPEWEKAVKQLVKDSLKVITRKTTVFLPNLRDDYEGANEWNRYVQSHK